MLGCYANARPHDPAIYTAAIAAVLAGYPTEVVMQVTDPREATCIQRRSKWLPEVAEVAAACDDAMRQIRLAAYLEQQRERDARAAESEARRLAELEKTKPEVMAKIAAWREQVGPMSKKPWELGPRKIGNLIPHIVGADTSEAAA